MAEGPTPRTDAPCSLLHHCCYAGGVVRDSLLARHVLTRCLVRVCRFSGAFICAGCCVRRSGGSPKGCADRGTGTSPSFRSCCSEPANLDRPVFLHGPHCWYQPPSSKWDDARHVLALGSTSCSQLGWLCLQVALKIIKHCKECMPALVTGQLLGLDIGTILEVTNCFPFPVQSQTFQFRNPCRRRRSSVWFSSVPWRAGWFAEQGWWRGWRSWGRWCKLSVGDDALSSRGQCRQQHSWMVFYVFQLFKATKVHLDVLGTNQHS